MSERYCTKEIAGEYIETWDRKSRAVVSAEKCASLLNAKDAEIASLRQQLDEACHVIIEAAGNWPTERDWCHCEACAAVARRMENAGWCDHAKNRWWDATAPDAAEGGEK